MSAGEKLAVEIANPIIAEIKSAQSGNLEGTRAARRAKRAVKRLAREVAALRSAQEPAKAGGSVPEGWVLVPRVLTIEMRNAFALAQWGANEREGGKSTTTWDAMLDAAPPAPSVSGPELPSEEEIEDFLDRHQGWMTKEEGTAVKADLRALFRSRSGEN